MEGDPYNYMPMRYATPANFSRAGIRPPMEVLELEALSPPVPRAGWSAVRPIKPGDLVWKYALLWRAAEGLNGDVILRRA